MERYELETPKWLGDMFEVANAIAYDIKVPFKKLYENIAGNI